MTLMVPGRQGQMALLGDLARAGARPAVDDARLGARGCLEVPAAPGTREGRVATQDRHC